MENKTIIVGLGNTILSDDALGIIVGKIVYETLQKTYPAHNFTFTESSLSGWRLLDLVTGYKNVIIIDSVYSAGGQTGDLYIINDPAGSKINIQTSHGTGLHQVLTVARQCSGDLPENLSIYAVEVKNPYEFGETVSKELSEKIPEIVKDILDDISKIKGIGDA